VQEISIPIEEALRRNGELLRRLAQFHKEYKMINVECRVENYRAVLGLDTGFEVM
jgi:hypothetical protein